MEKLVAVFDLLPSPNIEVPMEGEEVFHRPCGYMTFHKYPFLIRLRFPFSPLAKSFIELLHLSPGQLMPRI